MKKLSEEQEEKKASIKFSPRLLELLSKFEEIELEDVDIEVGDLEIWLHPAFSAPAPQAVLSPKTVVQTTRPTRILEANFRPPTSEYPGQILEVKLGATKGEGGSRRKTIVIGGEKSPPFYLFENPTPNPPVISMDVFDIKPPLARAVKKHVGEVVDDPVAWAKLAVDEFGMDIITLHLLSIDPLIKDASPKEAAKIVENVLQAVDVPLVVGGCGNAKKDLQVFEKVVEVGEGERLLINSVIKEMDIERAATAIRKHGHIALSFSQMDLNQARELNRRLHEFLPKEQIVMDTSTAALGYGLEYAFTTMERARLAGLKGDPELQHPMSAGATNAWAAREAWMKMSPEWGPRELRGPMWETVTALTFLLAGVDLFMMMHPAAIKTVKEIVEELMKGRKGQPERIADWVSMKI